MTPQQHIDNLRAMNSSADGDAYVADLNTATLDQILDALDVTHPPTAAKKRDRIVRLLIGARLQGNALRGL